VQYRLISGRARPQEGQDCMTVIPSGTRSLTRAWGKFQQQNQRGLLVRDDALMIDSLTAFKAPSYNPRP
jgi:hypothetical protein